MEKLKIGRELLTAMLAHASDCLPEECCGLAMGKDGRITEVDAVENILHSPTEFRMEAVGQIRAMMHIENSGQELLAIYHSHPNGPETPSQTDLRWDMYPESYSIILAKTNGSWSVKCFKTHSTAWKEITISIDD